MSGWEELIKQGVTITSTTNVNTYDTNAEKNDKKQLNVHRRVECFSHTPPPNFVYNWSF